MIRSKTLAGQPGAVTTREPAEQNTDDILALLQLVDYLIGEARRVDSMTEYFLKMARMSLLECEQKRADVMGRH